MESLQARHSRRCQLAGKWTPLDADGCSCEPSLFVVVRSAGNKTDRHPAGQDRKQAAKALRAVEVKRDQGSYLAPVRQTFSDWSQQWLAGLQRKPSTARSYATTIRSAQEAFGRRQLRDLTADDLRRWLAGMTSSPSTRAKHLRNLRACLQAAVRSERIARNPVDMLGPSERPRQSSRESAYFTSAEVAQLFDHLDADLWRVLFETLLKTGIRVGEASALEWGDLDLIAGTITVRRSFTDGNLNTPKSGQRRIVDLPASLVDRLGWWWGQCGSPADDVLAFSASGGYMDSRVPNNALRRAMRRAGVSLICPNGEKRTVHSLRHTFASIALQNGRPLFWVSRTLGHGSVDITARVYAHWVDRSESRRQVELLEGAFGV